jgi:hypothetical protein
MTLLKTKKSSSETVQDYTDRFDEVLRNYRELHPTAGDSGALNDKDILSLFTRSLRPRDCGGYMEDKEPQSIERTKAYATKWRMWYFQNC